MNYKYIKNKMILGLVIANLIFAVGCDNNETYNDIESDNKYNVSMGEGMTPEEEVPQFEIFNKRNENAFFISYGLKDLEGEVVLEPRYSSVEPLGKDRLAITFIDNNYQTLLAPKALFNSQGEQLSDFMYYYIGNYENGVAFVNTENASYYIDKQGEKIDDMPTFEGKVFLEKINESTNEFNGRMNGLRIFVDQNGEMSYHDDKMTYLESGEGVEKTISHPNYATTILYPQIITSDHVGTYSNESMDRINQDLCQAFTEDYNIEADDRGVYADSYEAVFNLIESNKAFVVQKEGYYMPLGAAHGHPKCEYYNYDKKTGERINYYDLFDADHRTVDLAIVNSVNRKIDEYNKEGDFYDALTEEMGSFNAAILDEGLSVRFQAYEIAPYAVGMPEFYVSYEDLPALKNK